MSKPLFSFNMELERARRHFGRDTVATICIRVSVYGGPGGLRASALCTEDAPFFLEVEPYSRTGEYAAREGDPIMPLPEEGEMLQALAETHLRAWQDQRGVICLDSVQFAPPEDFDQTPAVLGEAA